MDDFDKAATENEHFAVFMLNLRSLLWWIKVSLLITE